MRKLLTRIATAVVLLAILVVVFFRLPEAATLGLLGAFVVAAAWEWAGFLAQPGPALRLGFAMLIGACIAALSMLPVDNSWLYGLLIAGLAWWCWATGMVLRYPVILHPRWRLFCGVLVLVPAWAAMLLLLRSPGGGPELLLLALAVIWAADVGAYAAGRRLGRHRLAPVVSPGKTWEGVAGGLVATALVAWVGAWALQLPVVPVLAISVCAAALSIVGDLTVSAFKRTVGLKDSGSLFPGHGGVLDRVDSLAAATPLFAFLASWAGFLKG